MLEAYGRGVVDAMPATQARGRSATFAPAPRPSHTTKAKGFVAMGPTTDSAVTMMLAGGSFFLYHKAADGAGVQRTPARVAYQRGRGAAAHLVVSASDATAHMDPVVFPLGSLKAVQLGKRSPELQSKEAAPAPSDRCFSLSREGGPDLSLEALSTEQVSAWLFAINTLVDDANEPPADITHVVTRRRSNMFSLDETESLQVRRRSNNVG